MLAGATHIDHVDLLRAGSTGRVLPFRVMAPSTVGSFLRSFTWGHVRQMEKVLTVTLGRAWRAGAGPPKSGVTLDLDSTICEVSGKAKQGAAYGYTGEWGYHPLLAFRADTGEVVGARLRDGGSQRGVVHFAQETIGRIRRAGARGRIVVRADSGFWSYAMLVALNQRSVGWSITARLNRRVKARISRIEEEAWTSIDYPRDGEAQVAETEYEMINPQKRSHKLKVRLVVRRTPPHRSPSPVVARLAPSRVRHQPGTAGRRSRPSPPAPHRRRRPRTTPQGRRTKKTSHHRRRPLSPSPRVVRTRYPRPQRSSRPHPSTLRCLLRQRRVAPLRRLGPQPLPSHSTPRRNTAEGAARAWTHHPHPTLRAARTLGQPQRTTHPAAARPMALGQRLPELPHQPQKPPTTLLNNPHHTTPRTPKPTSPRPNTPPTATNRLPTPPGPTEPHDHATKPSQTPPKPTSPPPPHHPTAPREAHRWIQAQRTTAFMSLAGSPKVSPWYGGNCNAGPQISGRPHMNRTCSEPDSPSSAGGSSQRRPPGASGPAVRRSSTAPYRLGRAPGALRAVRSRRPRRRRPSVGTVRRPLRHRTDPRIPRGRGHHHRLGGTNPGLPQLQTSNQRTHRRDQQLAPSPTPRRSRVHQHRQFRSSRTPRNMTPHTDNSSRTPRFREASTDWQPTGALGIPMSRGSILQTAPDGFGRQSARQLREPGPVALLVEHHPRLVPVDGVPGRP